MPERCPNCDAELNEGLAHCPICMCHVETARLYKQVEMLDGDVKGWIKVNMRITKRNELLTQACEGILDGLDSNYDPERAGLSNEDWEKRIQFAKQVLDIQGEENA